MKRPVPVHHRALMKEAPMTYMSERYSLIFLNPKSLSSIKFTLISRWTKKDFPN